MPAIRPRADRSDSIFALILLLGLPDPVYSQDPASEGPASSSDGTQPAPAIEQVLERLRKMEKTNQRLAEQVEKIDKKNQDLSEQNGHLSKENAEISKRFQEMSEKLKGLEEAQKDHKDDSKGKTRARTIRRKNPSLSRPESAPGMRSRGDAPAPAALTRGRRPNSSVTGFGHSE